MNAVYYCRVSTEEESQRDSLQSQIIEAKNCININGWSEVDSYVDEGKSGTQTKTRDEYNRLLADIETDKFQIIVIKCQDRLMRNVRDWYLFLDKLISNNKKLYYYLDNKFYTPDDALISGIKIILAEEYSRDLSKKLNNAHRNRQEKGTSVVITSSTWGLDKIDKKVVINEKEAEIVRLIFDLSMQGYGSRTISKELSNRGIKSRTGNDFAEITIRRIIRNPLFKGDVIMNKRHKDFNTKKTVNNPESEWITHENVVPAIVSKEVWEKANKMMDKKSVEVHSQDFATKQVGRNIGKFNLSSKIYCNDCGSVYWRRYRKNKKGEQIVDWSCSEYIKRGRKSADINDTRGKYKIKVEAKEGGCDNIHISEIDLNNTLTDVSRDVFNKDKTNIINKFIAMTKMVFSSDGIVEERRQIDLEKNKIIKQKNMLMDKLLEEIITNDDYKRKDSELEDRLKTISINEQMLIERERQSSSIDERIADIRNLLETEGDDESNLVKLINHIDKIIVYTDHLDIYLDFYEAITVPVIKSGKRYKLGKNYQYVNSTKYLIPHTDTYRYDGKYKEVIVKVFI